jgi:hypothetical protein
MAFFGAHHILHISRIRVKMLVVVDNWMYGDV